MSSEICQKIGSLDGKTEQSRLKVPIFFQKSTEFIEKQKTVIDYLIEKISVPTNLMCWQWKVSSEMCKTASLDLRSAVM